MFYCTLTPDCYSHWACPSLSMAEKDNAWWNPYLGLGSRLFSEILAQISSHSFNYPLTHKKMERFIPRSQPHTSKREQDYLCFWKYWVVICLCKLWVFLFSAFSPWENMFFCSSPRLLPIIVYHGAFSIPIPGFPCPSLE